MQKNLEQLWVTCVQLPHVTCPPLLHCSLQLHRCSLMASWPTLPGCRCSQCHHPQDPWSQVLAVGPQCLQLPSQSHPGLILQLRTRGWGCHLVYHLSRKVAPCSRRPGAWAQVCLLNTKVALVFRGDWWGRLWTRALEVIDQVG